MPIRMLTKAKKHGREHPKCAVGDVMRRNGRHIHEMTASKMTAHFDFAGPAELFIGGGRFGKRPRIIYRRFATGAEAVQFAIERQSAEKLATTVVEVDGARFTAAEIRNLYHRAEYPFPRRHAA